VEPTTGKRKTRGLQRRIYTYATIQAMTGLTNSTLRTYACQSLFDPDELESVIRWWLRREGYILLVDPDGWHLRPIPT